MELEERDKVRDEMQGIRVWVEAADDVLSEMEASNSTQELQVGPAAASVKLSEKVFALVRS